jgi:hypothetical protein
MFVLRSNHFFSIQSLLSFARTTKTNLSYILLQDKVCGWIN